MVTLNVHDSVVIEKDLKICPKKIFFWFRFEHYSFNNGHKQYIWSEEVTYKGLVFGQGLNMYPLRLLVRFR